MTCTTLAQPTGALGADLAALVAHHAELGEQIAAKLADPATAAAIAALPGESLAGFVTTLSAAVGSGTAAMTVLTGVVDAGTGPGTGLLVGGRYASTRRFLEVECGMSKQTASATVARARDLRGDYAVVEAPWLTGRLSSDAVREITVGVGSAIKRSGLPYEERELARKAAVETLIPLGEVGTVEDVRRAISHLKLLTDPDGATRAAMDAFDDQSLTVEQVGSMSKLTAWLTHENAAALMTVLTQRVDGMRRTGELADEERLAPEIDPDTFTGRRIAGEKHRHLLAVAFGDLVTGLLDDNAVGSHHGIAPHVTVTVDLARFEAGLGADLTMPGTDTPVLLANESVRRILCDCDLTPVVTRPLMLARPADPESCDRSLGDLLLEAAREVLYVGRTERVVPPRLRRALEARDRHCAFPGCRAHVRRCNAHHVHEWEHGGPTDLDNTVLLCVRHHHAVHEGGWRITRATGVPPGGTGAGSSPHPNDDTGPDQQGAPPVTASAHRAAPHRLVVEPRRIGARPLLGVLRCRPCGRGQPGTKRLWPRENCMTKPQRLQIISRIGNDVNPSWLSSRLICSSKR